MMIKELINGGGTVRIRKKLKAGLRNDRIEFVSLYSDINDDFVALTAG